MEKCFAGGAEGVCAHPHESPFVEMLACKVESIYLCRVNRIGGTQSVGIEVTPPRASHAATSRLVAEKCDQMVVGSP